MTLGLIGFSGTGKSSLANIALKYGFTVFDSDKEIEFKTGLTIETIFKQFGENYFRKIENSVLEQLVVSNYDIIAFGGGITPLSNMWTKIRKQNIFICFLKEDSEILFQRIGKTRPLLKNMSKQEFDNFFKKRELLYKKDCDLIFEINQNSIINVFEKLKVYI
jgi:shikimate kinase